MTVEITLLNINTGETNTVVVENVENSKCFSYIDNESNNCEMHIYDNGLYLLRKCADHTLELSLMNEPFCKVISNEGEIKFDAKIIDFCVNNDILVMRYKIDDEEREIKIVIRG